MAAKLIALWTKADDHEAFEADYLEAHVPLATMLEGVRPFFGKVVGPGPWARVAVLEFDSIEAAMGALGSEDGAVVMTDGQRLQEKHGNKLDAVLVQED